MQNTVQEFKVGDKFIVTNKTFRDQGYTEVYTVSKVGSSGMIDFRDHDGLEALLYTDEIEHYIPEPEKHIHHDLIVAWAKDPKGCIIQYFDEYLVEWKNTFQNSPHWDKNLVYRIKPKNKEVTRWKWVFKVVDGYEVTNGYYTEDEANKHFDKPLQKIEDSKVIAIEEV